MSGEERKCYYCKVPLTVDNEGEELITCADPDLPNGTSIIPCKPCEKGPEHQDRVETDRCNAAAESAYQEWCDDQEQEDTGPD